MNILITVSLYAPFAPFPLSQLICIIIHVTIRITLVVWNQSRLMEGAAVKWVLKYCPDQICHEQQHHYQCNVLRSMVSFDFLSFSFHFEICSRTCFLACTVMRQPACVYPLCESILSFPSNYPPFMGKQ